VERLPTISSGPAIRSESAMTDRFDSDYNLRLLIERMQRLGCSEHEIGVAVREACEEGKR
jgi:hypothetical protein